MQPNFTLPEPQMELIRAHVSEGETLFWAGCEPRCRFWLRQGLRLALFGLWTVLIGAITLRWLILPPRFLRDFFASLLPELSLLAITGLGGCLLVRAILNLRKSHPDVYALTSRRALVIAGGQPVRTWEYDSIAIRPIQIRQRRDGSGDIIFERRLRWVTDQDGRAAREWYEVAFYGVPCVDEVLRWFEPLRQPNLPDGNRR